MKKLFFAVCLLIFVSCENGDNPGVIKPEAFTESFENSFEGDYAYGYENDLLKCEYFFNEEYAYWGGFMQSKVFDSDAANGKFENQYAVYNTKPASGDSFLLYYYDSYSEPCDMIFKKSVMLNYVKLNLTTYTYASITDEDINTFARKFDEGDFLKVVFTPLDKFERPVGDGIECYVVDYRDGKRFVANNWQEFYLGIMAYGNVRVTIETSDVGEYGANTPLYICLDDLNYTLSE